MFDHHLKDLKDLKDLEWSITLNPAGIPGMGGTRRGGERERERESPREREREPL